MSAETTIEPGGREPPPGELVLVQRFLNTMDPESGFEAFTDAERLRAWLVEHELLDGGTAALGAADLRFALGFREALRALLLAHNGEALDPDAPRLLDEAARRARLRASFADDGGVGLAPADGGLDGAVGTLLAVVARSAIAGTWQRMKACRQETCRWAFYDHSKNRSGAWCSMSICGNRNKARAYRRRHSVETG